MSKGGSSDEQNRAANAAASLSKVVVPSASLTKAEEEPSIKNDDMAADIRKNPLKNLYTEEEAAGTTRKAEKEFKITKPTKKKSIKNGRIDSDPTNHNDIITMDNNISLSQEALSEELEALVLTETKLSEELDSLLLDSPEEDNRKQKLFSDIEKMISVIEVLKQGPKTSTNDQKQQQQPRGDRCFQLILRGVDLEAGGTGGRFKRETTSIFYKLSAIRQEAGPHKLSAIKEQAIPFKVYESEKIENNLNPIWHQSTTLESLFGDPGLRGPLLIDVFNQPTNGREVHIGSVGTSISELVQCVNTRDQIKLTNCHGRGTGSLEVVSARLVDANKENYRMACSQHGHVLAHASQQKVVLSTKFSIEGTCSSSHATTFTLALKDHHYIRNGNFLVFSLNRRESIKSQLREASSSSGFMIQVVDLDQNQTHRMGDDQTIETSMARDERIKVFRFFEPLPEESYSQRFERLIFLIHKWYERGCCDTWECNVPADMRWSKE